MTTITINILDGATGEVMELLQKMGVTVEESKLERLDKLTKEDYKRHFEHQAKANKNKLLKSL